ncbi:ATP-binding cassette domain-containing protein [Limosilactobacillus portuensis]|jgi:lincosamide and streptogramin A transport system ATP-binding/permease protein|uniref:ATP-binding cassette domain-containing protein n=1 Tax=Limosilactobacillus portuensis TaxID=2742601 RepID=UPI0025450BE7
MENLTIRNLSFAYPGQAPLFDHCNLDLDGDWKLGLLGRNGRGKTTLMKILRGLVNYQGSIITNLKPQYFPLTIKDPAFLAGDAVIEAVPNSFLEPWQLERELNLMATNPEILWQPYSTLSGGERTKLQLATLFASDYDYLLLDEPTNHLDQVGRKQVANYLRQKTTGFIITSHDREFLDQIIDHTLVIEKSQLVLERGNYSTYFKQKSVVTKKQSRLISN